MLNRIGLFIMSLSSVCHALQFFIVSPVFVLMFIPFWPFLALSVLSMGCAQCAECADVDFRGTSTGVATDFRSNARRGVDRVG